MHVGFSHFHATVMSLPCAFYISIFMITVPMNPPLWYFDVQALSRRALYHVLTRGSIQDGQSYKEDLGLKKQDARSI